MLQSSLNKTPMDQKTYKEINDEFEARFGQQPVAAASLTLPAFEPLPSVSAQQIGDASDRGSSIPAGSAAAAAAAPALSRKSSFPTPAPYFRPPPPKQMSAASDGLLRWGGGWGVLLSH